MKSVLAFHVFMGFLAIMNPIGNTPIFLGLVGDVDEKQRRMVARRAVFVAFVIVAIFAIGGNLIFRLFGITLPAFRIAGGILIFAIAYELLNGRRSHQHCFSEEEKGALEVEELEDIAVTPLATPLLAGPGTIATAMSFIGDTRDIGVILLVMGILGVVCLTTYLCFVYAQVLAKRVGQSWVNVVTRVMGLILAVIAVQMVIIGVKGVF
jgi:multiple antibiotic resistance protein